MEQEPEPVAIRIREDGPLVVTGAPVVTDHEGNVLECGDRATIALCRCGQSASKPLCDGAHRGNFDGTLSAGVYPQATHEPATERAEDAR